MTTFTFDGPNRRVLIDAEVGDSSFTPVEVYSAWKAWVVAGNAQYEQAFSESVGGNDLGGGASLDAYIFLRNDLGWRIRPDARDHVLTVDGNLFGADTGAPVFIPPSSPATVQIERSFSARALAVEGGGGGGASASSIAAAVWSHATATDLVARVQLAERILRNKTVTDPATGTMTVYADDGVTPLLACQIFEDVGGAQPFRGSSANRRDRLE